MFDQIIIFIKNWTKSLLKFNSEISNVTENLGYKWEDEVKFMTELLSADIVTGDIYTDSIIVESIMMRLLSIDKFLTSEDIKNKATKIMSTSYLENINVDLRRIEEDKKKVLNHFEEMIENFDGNTVNALTMSPSKLPPKFSPKGRLSTALFIKSIEKIQYKTESAKDKIKDFILEASNEILPGLSSMLSPYEKSSGCKIIIPTKQCITYNFMPLIEKKYMPMSSTMGLNYNAIERFRTINLSIVPNELDENLSNAFATLDKFSDGKICREYKYEEKRDIFHNKDRVSKYNELTELIILDSMKLSEIKNSFEIRQEDFITNNRINNSKLIEEIIILDDSNKTTLETISAIVMKIIKDMFEEKMIKLLAKDHVNYLSHRREVLISLYSHQLSLINTIYKKIQGLANSEIKVILMDEKLTWIPITIKMFEIFS